MWYLPVTDRLRRMFLNPKEAALMTWWDDERKVDDDTIAHPADCSQWQAFDAKYKAEFSDDPRNVQPPNVFVSEEEVPSPHHSYLRPKQPGIDIDVFLEPLIQEMERLWRYGEPMYDAFRRENFICKAIIFVTTNDYPALFALSG